METPSYTKTDIFRQCVQKDTSDARHTAPPASFEEMSLTNQIIEENPHSQLTAAKHPRYMSIYGLDNGVKCANKHEDVADNRKITVR